MYKPNEYGVLVKPKVLLAMIALYITSYLGSFTYQSGAVLNLNQFLIGLGAVTSAVGGANALNCYYDRDIDAVMARTFGRPLVSGTISTLGALAFSAVLMTSAIVLSLQLGVFSFLLFVEGTSFYLIVYTILMKRRSILNVLATAPSVAAPAWFGWYLGGAPLLPVGILLGFLVATWGPLHIWSLSYSFSKDYNRAGVPMLVTVVRQKEAVLGIFLSLSLMIFASYLLVPWTASSAYAIFVSIFNILIAIQGIRFYFKPTYRASWWLFKMTAPYIVLVLVSFTIDNLLIP
jgi:protoheme IX farnesyltransferase